MMEKHTNKDPLLANSSINELVGIGNKRMAAFGAYGLRTVEDLLRFFPRAYINRSQVSPIGSLINEGFASVVGIVEDVKVVPRKRFNFSIRDESGRLGVVFFGSHNYLQNNFEEGVRINAWGKVSFFNGMPQMAHPDYKILEQGAEPEKGIFPIYIRPEGLKEASIDSKIIQSAVKDALKRTREHLPDALPLTIVKKRDFPMVKDVYRELHFPSNDDPAVLDGLKVRLKYEEAFSLCLKMAGLAKYGEDEGLAFKPSLSILSRVYHQAGFAPTNAQMRVIKEIEEDLFAGHRLYRLLQGDVGSGKTFVCAVAIAHVLENGYQAAMMAPTEILARQHFRELSRLFEGSGKHVALFTGGIAGAEKRKMEKSLAEGEIDLAIGTHALLGEGILFKRLGIIIVDEQHRFGVRQRLALKQKGEAPAILVVSATPIPRTMAMMLYGDLKVSEIDELPPGRILVKTFRVGEGKRMDMYRFIEDKIKAGGRAFFILPLVNESEKLEEIKSVISMGAHLQDEIFKNYTIEILHGKMKQEEKEGVLRKFRDGTCHVLAATTVVEVGIDIPEADILVIEHAERFGLAQLHQLRGRIGRGTRESFCFLLTSRNCSEEALIRLKRFTETHDGFAIAELDFELRGTGELAGLRQSGVDGFRFLNLVRDRKIIEMAKEDAIAIVKGSLKLDPGEEVMVRELSRRYDGIEGELLKTA